MAILVLVLHLVNRYHRAYHRRRPRRDSGEKEEGHSYHGNARYTTQPPKLQPWGGSEVLFAGQDGKVFQLHQA
jgi:hypothetical protein